MSPYRPRPRAHGEHALAQNTPDVRLFPLGYQPRALARLTSWPPARPRLREHSTTSTLLPQQPSAKGCRAHQAQLRMHQPPNIRG
jgi:hypothetical protein